MQVFMVSQLARPGMGDGAHELLVVDGNSCGVYDDYDSFYECLEKQTEEECRKNG